MSLLLNMLSGFVIGLLLRSKCLLISWLQSLSTVFLEPKKIKSVTVSIYPYLPWSDGTRCHDLSFWILSFKPYFSLSSFTKRAVELCNYQSDYSSFLPVSATVIFSISVSFVQWFSVSLKFVFYFLLQNIYYMKNDTSKHHSNKSMKRIHNAVTVTSTLSIILPQIPDIMSGGGPLSILPPLPFSLQFGNF